MKDCKFALSSISASALMVALAGCASHSAVKPPPADTAIVVNDTYNNRVLIYNYPATTGESAVTVLGQASLTTNASGATASTMNWPFSSSLDAAGNLWVSDFDNCRILQFKPPFTTGMAASVALGQTSLTANLCAAPPSPVTLGNSFKIATDGTGHLWVSDFSDSRVLRFSPPFTTGMAADMVLGQADFTSHACATTATGVCEPLGLALDPSGNLWVADAFNCRVLEYSPPFSTGMAAGTVIGSDSFTATNCGISATGFSTVFGIAFDANGDLWTADTESNRVLLFKAPLTTGMAATLVLGQTSFTAHASSATASTLNTPAGISFDLAGNAYVADAENNRVLVFAPPFTTGMSASKVLGQTSLTVGTANQGNADAGPATLNVPTDIGFLE